MILREVHGLILSFTGDREGRAMAYLRLGNSPVEVKKELQIAL